VLEDHGEYGISIKDKADISEMLDLMEGFDGVFSATTVAGTVYTYW